MWMHSACFVVAKYLRTSPRYDQRDTRTKHRTKRQNGGTVLCWTAGCQGEIQGIPYMIPLMGDSLGKCWKKKRNKRKCICSDTSCHWEPESTGRSFCLVCVFFHMLSTAVETHFSLNTSGSCGWFIEPKLSHPAMGHSTRIPCLTYSEGQAT